MAAEKAAVREENPLSEFKACITAYHNWSNEILNALNVLSETPPFSPKKNGGAFF